MGAPEAGPMSHAGSPAAMAPGEAGHVRVWEVMSRCASPTAPPRPGPRRTPFMSALLLLLATTYAGGLRVSEVIALTVTDLDRERMTIRVEPGKGGKDRYVPL